jgi:hypothetical protein
VQFGKLSDNVKEEIVFFTDASASNSTLIVFCNDLKNTNGFFTFLNNPNHLIYANGFLGYRSDNKHNYKPEDYEVLTEELPNLNLSSNVEKMVGSWLDHAVDASNRNGYYKQGKDFEIWIKGQLSNDRTPIYQQLKTDFNAEGWNLDEYSIYSQVYFCINNSASCIKEGDYFIADFVFVKVVKNLITGLDELDVKIADTKLSSRTSFTQNQKNAMRLIPNPFFIRSFKSQDLIKGIASNLFQIGKQIPNKNNFYKIYSGGSSNTYGGIKK